MVRICLVAMSENMKQRVNLLLEEYYHGDSQKYAIDSYEDIHQLMDVSQAREYRLILAVDALEERECKALFEWIHQKMTQCYLVLFGIHSLYNYNLLGLHRVTYVETQDPMEWIENKFRLFYYDMNAKTMRILNTPRGNISIQLKSIVYIELIGRNPFVVCSDDSIIKLSTMTLKHALSLLDSSMFERINNHIILNLDYVLSYKRDTVSLKYKNLEFTLSRGRAKIIRDRMQKHLYHYQ